MRELDQFELPPGIHQLNSKPIGKLRNYQAGDVGKRFLVVKSGGQHFTDLCEKMLLFFDALAFGDVVRDVRGAGNAAVAIMNRRDRDRDRDDGPILS